MDKDIKALRAALTTFLDTPWHGDEKFRAALDQAYRALAEAINRLEHVQKTKSS